ncbi:hypothetical protein AAHU05_21660 [Klebsiella variicola subsp. variicola]|uniref:hypothetical protein n=1 Tax=Klebsiella variicola TaxID=244366 RepID=UPI0035A04CA1
MDPVTLSTIASVLLKAGPSLVRTVGGWFGSDSTTAKAADSVASIVETVNGAINPADQQRVLEQKLAQLPPEQLVQLEGLKVQLQQFQLERDKAQMADQQAAHHEQQETIRNGDNATDEYVRQTRPLMARLSLYSSIAYVMIMSLGQQAGAVAGAFGHAFSMPEPDWDISLMLATPALGYLGFRMLDGFARYSKSSKHKVMVGK